VFDFGSPLATGQSITVNNLRGSATSYWWLIANVLDEAIHDLRDPMKSATGQASGFVQVEGTEHWHLT